MADAHAPTTLMDFRWVKNKSGFEARYNYANTGSNCPVLALKWSAQDTCKVTFSKQAALAGLDAEHTFLKGDKAERFVERFIAEVIAVENGVLDLTEGD